MSEASARLEGSFKSPLKLFVWKADGTGAGQFGTGLLLLALLLVLLA